MKAREAAREAIPRLAHAGIEDATFEAELLARRAANLTRPQYFSGEELRADQLARFHKLLARRLSREPAAHILGMREFYGRDFEVTPDALVPRPETELLVDLALRALNASPSPPGRGVGGEGATPPLRAPAERGPGGEEVVEIGAGTGCIAISVALYAPHARVIATDISPAALAVARRNAARHHANVSFLLGDLATPIDHAGIILANLPYIPTHEVAALAPEVRDFEPLVALDGGPDGLALIRRLVEDCANRLRPRLLALEVGYGQAAAVAAFARSHGADVEVVKDLAGIDRVVCARWA